MTQYVNAPADSIKLRELQLAVMPIAATISSAAITGSIDSAISAGFTGSCPVVPTPNGSGFTYCFDGDQPPQPDRVSDQGGAAGAPAPLTNQARIDSDFRTLGYTDSPAAPAS